MNEDYYTEEEYRPSSPGLVKIIVKAAPSPSPPPKITPVYHPPVSSPSSRRRKKANRRKTQPTQGDWVLIREMDPNRPDIAQQVSQHALNSDSDSNPESDEEMDDQPPNSATSGTVHDPNVPARSGAQPFSLQQPSKDTFIIPQQPTATSQHRDSVVEADIPPGTAIAHKFPIEPRTVNVQPNGTRANTNDGSMHSPAVNSTPPSATSPNRTHRTASVASTYSQDESLTVGSLRQLTIPQSGSLSSDTLAAFQPQSPPRDAASPNTQLPSILQALGDVPRSASISEEGRPNGFVHRPSISSSIMESPTSIMRQLSVSSHAPSPATPFPPLSASSPISAGGAMQRGDPFLREGGHIFGTDHRRPSQASENGRYPPTLHSGSTSEGYQSSDGPSPGAAHSPNETRPRHMSLDGALANSSAIILPPPIGSGIQHVPSHGNGSFRCDHPGCNALPFQTQYLLK